MCHAQIILTIVLNMSQSHICNVKYTYFKYDDAAEPAKNLNI